MGRRTGRQDPGGTPLAAVPVAVPLLDGRGRRLAAAVLVACVAVTALLGLLFYHRQGPGAVDSAIDNWIGSGVGSNAAADALRLAVMPGEPAGVTAMTLVLVVICLVTRRLRGALLTVVAVPVAGGLADLVIKPFVGRIYGQDSLTFPSGHATGVFTVAGVMAVLLLGPQYRQIPVRFRAALVLASYAACAVISVALVKLDFHYFTDTVAGGTTATAVVLATAFVLDLPLVQRLVPTSLTGPPPGRAAGDAAAQLPEPPGRRVEAATERKE